MGEEQGVKYPSELLRDLADKIDPVEDRILERYNEHYISTKDWLKSWKVWEYRAQQEKLNTLRERHEGLRKDYYKLCKLYREKTGEAPPLSTWAALSSMDSALQEIKRRWMESLRRMERS